MGKLHIINVSFIFHTGVVAFTYIFLSAKHNWGQGAETFHTAKFALLVLVLEWVISCDLSIAFLLKISSLLQKLLIYLCALGT